MKARLPPRRLALQALLRGLLLVSALLYVLVNTGFVQAVLALAGLGLLLAALPGLVTYLRSLNPVAGTTLVELSVSDAGVEVDGKLRMPRGDVVDGFIQPEGSNARLHLADRKGRALEVVLPTVDDARAVLRETGVGADRTAVRFRVFAALARLPVRTILAVSCAAIALAFSVWALATRHFTYGPLFLLGQLLPMLFGRIPGTLVVGMDGLHAPRPRWAGGGRAGGRFLAFTDVDRFDVKIEPKTKAKTLMVVTKTGKSLDLAEHLGVVWPDGETLAAVVGTIQQAHAAARSSASVATLDAALARGERSIPEWVAALKRVTKQGDYRHAAVVPEQLLAVVEDPAADAAARAAAAIALRAHDTADPAVQRIRVAAAASASPRARVVLETVAATDDEEELASTLEAVEREASR